MPDLKSAAELAAPALQRPYPNDSAEYRRARVRLLEEEIELRRKVESVARMRRELPLGGEPPKYEFTDEDGKSVGLADLFGQHDTLITYFWMYGPQRKRPCPMCTSLLGGLDVPSRDLTQRVSLAIIGRSPVSRQLAFARERGWRNLKFFQCGDDFARDVHALKDDGEWAAEDVWVRRDGKVHHFWGGEMGGDMADPGQDPRGSPDPAILWTWLDLTPEGRGKDWYPKLEY